MFRQIGFWEILVILLVVLLIFGPSKLPQLGRSVGETLKEFKKSVKPGDADAGTEKKEKDA